MDYAEVEKQKAALVARLCDILEAEMSAVVGDSGPFRRRIALAICPELAPEVIPENACLDFLTAPTYRERREKFWSAYSFAQRAATEWAKTRGWA